MKKGVDFDSLFHVELGKKLHSVRFFRNVNACLNRNRLVV